MRLMQKTGQYTFTVLPKDAPAVEAEIRALGPERYLRRTATCVSRAGEVEVVELVFDMRHRTTEIYGLMDRIRASGTWLLVQAVDVTPA
jgi:hypothetical protein